MTESDAQIIHDANALTLDAMYRVAHMHGDATAFEWSEAIFPWIARLAWHETDYGKHYDAEGRLMLPQDCGPETLSWFTLLIAADLRSN